MGSRPLARALALLAALLSAAIWTPSAGCGAKTGLRVPEDAPVDAAIDVPGQTPLVCGTFSIKNQLASLDLFIALDKSGSMSEETAGGSTKMEAVAAALSGFVEDPKSAGIGVAISPFPVFDFSAQEVCSNDVACDQMGACEPLSVCYPSGNTFCSSDAECAAGETCARAGLCGTLQSDPCVVDKIGCTDGAVCLPSGWCTNNLMCLSSTYKPQIAPQVLPGGAPLILALLNSQVPNGPTPTAPALSGAIEAAIENSAENPTHKSIVLLATDGFPSSCPPLYWGYSTSAGIPRVVEVAKTGSSSGVQSFVIGVFAPAEAISAQQNLDAIAAAGGTEKSYIVKTDQPVSAQLTAALNEIRVNATACDYALPRPGGEPLDATRMKVVLRGSFGELTLERRQSLADCDPVTGGYVFDKDPFGPQPPARLQLCPASCALVRSDPAIEIDVVVACEDASVH